MEPGEYERMAAAEDRHWWYAGLHDLVLRLARAEAARLARPLAMLDAGCGTGRLCQLLQSLGEVTGCDIHAPALDLAARCGVARLRHCDIAAPALGIEQFDLITTMDVLYHRRVEDESAALRNLHRALRIGGLLLLQVPAFECLRGSHDLAVHGRRRYRRGQVARLLTRSGFTVESVTCRLFLFFPPMLAWRLASRIRPRSGSDAPRPSDVAHAPSPGLNRLLLSAVKFENSLVAAGIHLPLGTSIFAIARR
jgi:SAM-dependent methyltransferase